MGFGTGEEVIYVLDLVLSYSRSLQAMFLQIAEWEQH